VDTGPLIQLAEGHPEALVGTGGWLKGSQHPRTDPRCLDPQRASVPTTNDSLRTDRAISAAIGAALDTGRVNGREGREEGIHYLVRRAQSESILGAGAIPECPVASPNHHGITGPAAEVWTNVPRRGRLGTHSSGMGSMHTGEDLNARTGL
jgi:hypothetical protein